MTETDAPDGGFLGRWSRRKLEGHPVEPVEQPPAEAPLSQDAPESALTTDPQSAETGTGLSATESEERLLTDEDMPPLESLNADSDYSPFFSEGVSKQLRNLALKRLFFSGKFAIRDGLDDYDDDFTKFEPLGDTITSDMKFHQRRKEKARLAKLEEERLEQERLDEEEKAAQVAANEEPANTNEPDSPEAAGESTDDAPTPSPHDADQSLERRNNVADDVSPLELAAKAPGLLPDNLSSDNPPERRSKLTRKNTPEVIEAAEKAEETTRIENEKHT